MSDAAAPAFSIGKDTRCKLTIDSLFDILMRERLALSLFLKKAKLILAILKYNSSLLTTFHLIHLILTPKEAG